MKFLTPLRVEKIGARRWILIDDLIFESEYLKGELIALRGFQTDFASIPRIFWTIFPPVGNYDPAAVIHDAGYSRFLYNTKLERMHTVKSVSDKLFYEALKCCIGPKQAWLMYQAVKIGGDPK